MREGLEENKMDVQSQIVPLDTARNIYAIADENGNLAGTGTRQVCEVMLYIMRKLRATNSRPETYPAPEPRYRNVRAAITI